MSNLKLLASPVLDIWRESQNLKSKSRDPFDLILHFSLLPVVISIRAKVEVSNYNPSEIWRGAKLLKVGHVTPLT